MRPPIDWPQDEPTAEVTKVGRWKWRVRIVHGIMQYGPDGYGWHVFGRQRAERKARRELAHYLAQQIPESFTVVNGRA